MRRLLALGTAAVAALGLVRLLSRRRAAEPTAPAPVVDQRADELRQKLAESRSAAVETPVEPAGPGPDDADARRRSVHEQGRAVAERMRNGTDA